MTELNLVPAIQAVERQIKELEQNFNKKVQPYREGLAQLRKMNTACERCNGLGKILRPRLCAEDDRPDPYDPVDYITCPVCNGTGKVKV